MKYETASVRIELRITPSQHEQWSTIMLEEGIKTVKDLVVEAIEAFGSRSGDAADMARLGRAVLALTRGIK